VSDTPNRARALFEAALERPAAERDSFLAAACGDDPALRRRLDALLAAHGQPDPILDRPAADHLGVETVPAEDAAPAAPPGYVLAGRVGRGGMGEVYRARDTRLGRDVAVKVLQARFGADPAYARRFLAEAGITAGLQHPGVPPVHEVGTLSDGRPFLVMKLVAGRTLADLLRDRPDPGADRGRLVAAFEGVCQAVGYAHSRGVVHRDLKPANVMVGAFGEVQVMDWGLAKELACREPEPPEEDPAPADAAHRQGEAPTPAPGRRETDPTRPGLVMGTPGYMAPEQARGGPADSRADVFGLGAVLCAILTGEPPFTGPDTAAVVARNAAGDLADARSRLAACGAEPDLVALCERCLSPAPADRPADAGAVADAVAAFRARAEERARRAEVERATADARAVEERKRRRVLAAAAGLVALVLGGGAGVSAWQAVRATRAERATAEQLERTQQAEEAANAEKTRARAAEARATQEARDAAAFSEFLVNNVMAAGPEGVQGGLGIHAKLVDLLRFAEKEVDRVFAGRPKAEGRARRALGAAWRNLGRLDAAAPHLRRAVELHRRAYGPAAAETCDATNSLAVLCYEAGQYADAVPLFQEALAGWRGRRGAADPEALTAAINLGGSYAVLGRFDEAFPLLHKAADDARGALGESHPLTLRALSGLAQASKEAGRLAEAERLQRTVLAGYRNVLGPRHLRTLQAKLSLGDLCREMGRLDNAVPLVEEALAGFRQAGGARHPQTLQALCQLGGLRMTQGRPAEAEKLLQEALDGQRAVLGEAHLSTLGTLNTLGVLRQRQGRLAEAAALHKQTLALTRKALGNAHPRTRVAVHNLAGVYLQLGSWREAAPLVAEELRGHAARPAGDPARVQCESFLGIALAHAGRPEEAYGHLQAGRDALGVLKNLGPREQALLRSVTEALVGVCDRTGRPAEAARWRAALAKLSPAPPAKEKPHNP
jgi:tetratricopeptide (TPR) repeat protein